MFEQMRRSLSFFAGALVVASMAKCGTVWASQQPDSQPPHWSVVSPPVVGPDGTIYILASMGDVRPPDDPEHNAFWMSEPGRAYLYAISPDGTQKWRSDLGSGEAGYGSPQVPLKIGPSGAIYVAYSGKLYAIDSHGSGKWKFPFTGEFSWLDAGPHDIVYFFAGKVLYAVSSDGALKWKKSSQVKPIVGPDGTVY